LAKGLAKSWQGGSGHGSGGRGGGGETGGGGGGGGGSGGQLARRRRTTLIKSNNPHLAGGEKRDKLLNTSYTEGLLARPTMIIYDLMILMWINPNFPSKSSVAAATSFLWFGQIPYFRFPNASKG